MKVRNNMSNIRNEQFNKFTETVLPLVLICAITAFCVAYLGMAEKDGKYFILGFVSFMIIDELGLLKRQNLNHIALAIIILYGASIYLVR